MNLKLNAHTPKGTFGVVTNKVESGLYAAAVMYQAGGNAEHHVVYGETEQQAVADLQNWCQQAFGQPSEIR